MSFSIHGIWISFALLIVCGVLFFFNKKPKFLVPVSLVKKKSWLIYTILVCCILFSIILLPLRLSFVRDKQVVVVKDIPIQIILDVSLSMAANDIDPSRFSAAKDSLISLVQELKGYYISLITFSGKPFVYIPFSSDSPAIINKLQDMNLGDFPPVKEFLGTAIGDALLLGVHNLQKFTHQEMYKPGMVILITDGDSNIGFDPVQVLSYYQKTKVPLYVLGVGQENYLIGRDSWNDDVMTSINLPLLYQLADTTGGKFYRVLGDTSFIQFFDEFAKHVVVNQQEKIQPIYRELNDYLMYFLVLSLFGLFVFRFSIIFFVKRS